MNIIRILLITMILTLNHITYAKVYILIKKKEGLINHDLNNGCFRLMKNHSEENGFLGISTLYDLQGENKINIKEYKGPEFTSSLFSLDPAKEKIKEEIKEEINGGDLFSMEISIDKKQVIKIVTADSKQTGDNTFGYIVNMKNELVGVVQDSEIKCLPDQKKSK